MRRFLALLFLVLAGPAFAQLSPSGYPDAIVPLNGLDAVAIDQGSGCSAHTLPCTTGRVPSIRLGQPLVQATPPLSPFTLQGWWDNSANPVIYKIYNGLTWVPIYQIDSVSSVESFPGNVYFPTGSLAIGTTSVAPNWPITLFNNNAATNPTGITINGYENATASVGSLFRGFAARGTLSAPTQIQSDDLLTGMHGSGYWSGKTNAYFIGGDQRGAVEIHANENWLAATNNGTYVSVKTTPAGATTMAEVARFDGQGYLGIGTTAPNYGLTLSLNNLSSGSITQAFVVNAFENATGLVGSGFRGFVARGTASSPTGVVSNDQLTSFQGSGFWTGKTNAFFTANDARAGIVIRAAENWTGSANNGTYMLFSTTTNGTSSNSERMRIQASGGISIGTTTDPGLNNLMVSGNLSVGSSTLITMNAGELGLAKIAASGTAPGAGNVKIAAVAGTTGGTCKLIMYAGTSVTPTTIIDNVGAGC